MKLNENKIKKKELYNIKLQYINIIIDGYTYYIYNIIYTLK
jgi:hypothetical protein